MSKSKDELDREMRQKLEEEREDREIRRENTKYVRKTKEDYKEWDKNR